MVFFSLLVSFLCGFLSLALIEGCAIFFIVKRLRSRRRPVGSASSLSLQSTAEPLGHPHIFLKGTIWVAAAPSSWRKDVAKASASTDRDSREYKRRKDSSHNDLFEMRPSKRHAQLEDNILTLVGDDGSEEHIDMVQYDAVAVSGGNQASGKWAKKYPIKLESKEPACMTQDSVRLLYLETGWEKETWCQALRAASRWENGVNDWYFVQKKEFHEYALRLTKEYPASWNATLNKDVHTKDERGVLVKPNPIFSRKQKIWKKLVHLGSSRGQTLINRGYSEPHDPKSILHREPVRTHKDIDIPTTLMQHGVEDDVPIQRTASSSSMTAKSDKVGGGEKTHGFLESHQGFEHPLDSSTLVDEGTMSWNVLFSRLFFDAAHSSKFQTACHMLIEKQLAKIVAPGYISSMSCTGLELGMKPPFFHNMQLIPSETDLVCALEAGMEYCGGALVKIETRLDIHDFTTQQTVGQQETLESTLSNAVAADLLQNIKKTVEVGSDLDQDASMIIDSENTKAYGGVLQSKGCWKGILSRVAEHVSQVPIALSLRVASLSGRISLQIKPPPTDRVWFGFTTMPSIDIQLEPCLGDYKITTGPLVTYIGNKIKMLIQDNLVLPNCESIHLPWMISESNDWIPRSALPAPWVRSNSHDTLRAVDTNAADGNDKSLKVKEAKSFSTASTEDALDANGFCNGLQLFSTTKGSSSENEGPLLDNHKVAWTSDIGWPHAVSTILKDASPGALFLKGDEVEEQKSGKPSRQAKMRILGKKMGEKLDEKRRIMMERVREGLEKLEG